MAGTEPRRERPLDPAVGPHGAAEPARDGVGRGEQQRRRDRLGGVEAAGLLADLQGAFQQRPGLRGERPARVMAGDGLENGGRVGVVTAAILDDRREGRGRPSRRGGSRRARRGRGRSPARSSRDRPGPRRGGPCRSPGRRGTRQVRRDAGRGRGRRHRGGAAGSLRAVGAPARLGDRQGAVEVGVRGRGIGMGQGEVGPPKEGGDQVGVVGPLVPLHLLDPRAAK